MGAVQFWLLNKVINSACLKIRMVPFLISFAKHNGAFIKMFSNSYLS